MRKRIAIVLMLVVLVVASIAIAQQRTPTLEMEVQALMAQHDQALSNLDLNGILATYRSGDEIALMGTGPGEFYVGRQGVRSAYSNFFEGARPGSFSQRFVAFRAATRDNSGWFMATSQATLARNNEPPRTFGINWSGVVTRENNQWRFAALHFSMLAPPDRGAPAQQPPAPPR